MTACIICPPLADGSTHDPDYERGYLCCWRAWGRMAGALRAIPGLCADLSGLGFVVRNGPSDPVAHVLPSGPLNGSRGSPRVNGSREAPVPIRIDPTDLLARSRPASLAVAVSGAHAQDQVGHLAVATELEFWVRDWAGQLGENAPIPLVPILCTWLLDRLDWACRYHYALDEFAEALRRIHGALYGLCGYGEPRHEILTAPCSGCGMLTLFRDSDMERIVCAAGCAELLTDEGYAEYAQRLIKENPS